MFRKAPTLSSQSPLKSSARRALAQEIATLFSIPLEDAKSLVPGDLKQCKGTTSAGEYFTLFLTEDPLFFRNGKGEQGLLVPTLYTFCKSPNRLSLSVLVTNDMVLEKLAGGADLMLPGISSRSLESLSAEIPKGGLVGIETASRSGTIRAIGTLSASSRTLKQDTSGKAVEILHVEGDTIWAMGIQEYQPSGGRLVSSQDESSQDNGETLPDLEKLALADTNQAGPAAEAVLTASDVDAILREALLYAIAIRLSKESSALPISSSKFIDSYILPSRRASAATHEAGIKKSSHKNASAFLKHAKKDGLINIKEVKGGETVVTSVDFDHAEVKAIKTYKTVADLQKQEKKKETTAESQQAKASQRSVDIVQLYKPHGNALPLCSVLGLGQERMYLPTEIRTAINEYITKEDLVNVHDAGYIMLNEPLARALLKKGEQLDFMPRAQVMERFLDAMQAWYSVKVVEGGKTEEQVHKGIAKKITVSVKKRQGKKVVSIIEGLESFLIPYQKLSEELQVKCASSSTTNELAQSSAKRPLHEVVVQGDQTATISKELVETWGVPKKWIEISK